MAELYNKNVPLSGCLKTEIRSILNDILIVKSRLSLLMSLKVGNLEDVLGYKPKESAAKLFQVQGGTVDVVKNDIRLLKRSLAILADRLSGAYERQTALTNRPSAGPDKTDFKELTTMELTVH